MTAARDERRTVFFIRPAQRSFVFRLFSREAVLRLLFMPSDALAQPSARLAFLRSVVLFASLPEAPLQRLAGAGQPRRLQKGQLLFGQGEPGDAVYVVAAGSIAIVLATTDGRELVINEMRPGDFFGELALFPGQTHTAGAVAGAASLVLCLPCAAFLAQLDTQPPLMP